MDMHSDNTAATAGGSSRFTDVAIIGMAGRFPGAASVAELWQRLCAGTECITHEMQPERGDIISGNSNYPVHAHAAVDGIELFDAEFFGYSSREADLIDPQQRVFLECAWEAMEDAGQAVGRPNGRAAVFAGSGVNTYGVQVAANSRDRSGVDGLQLTIGNDKDYLASRISYKLNFTGPSVTVQTACSTSLVAVHLACQSLIDLECDIALAGGVSIRCPTPRTYPYTPGGIYSPDGHCRPFDAAAAGTVPASGAGVVVLKRLADAIRDGNRIYAVIRGSAINNDGYDKAGFTAPSLTGQVTVIRAALDAAQVPPPSIDFVETHGTATPLGDAVEIAALKEALAGPRHAACALGAIKSNLGHLDTAAGVAGLIKAALCLNHECRPATLHHEKDNPVLGLAEFPFQVDRELTQWPRGSVPRRAGVSSFGIGGTNAHVILEEAPALPQAAADCADEVHVLTLSARTPTALAMAASRLATHLTAHPEASLRDVCFTLQVGRASLKHRRAFACNDVAEAIEALDSLTTPAAPAEGAPPPVIFMFSGQVAARAEAWAPLYRNVAQFRRAFDECARCILELCGEDITRRMAGGSACSAGRDLPGSQRDSLFLFGVEYATAQMLRGLGVEPAAAIGHALGRVAAGCVCGLFGLEDAVRVLLGRHPSTLQDPAIALMSGDGTWVTGATSCAADYSARNVPEPAGFEQGICGIAREYPGAVYLDIGPRQTLAALARSTLRAADPSAAVFPLQVAPEGAQSEQRTLGQTLGELWMRGLDLDWSLWHDGRARRVSLPAYPFERSRHWALAEGLQASATAAVSMEATAFTAASRLPLSRWISLPVWMEAPTSHLQPPPALEAGGCYVVLGRSPLARALRKRLRALGATVIQLTPGARYRRRGEHTYSVDCRRAEDFSRLLRELRPRHVPHTLIQVLAEAPDEAAWTLMQIARSATNAGLPTFELVVCGRELAAIAPHEQVNPFGAMVTGVLQCIPLEMARLSCRLIDVSPDREDPVAADEVIRELHRPTDEGQLALRDGIPWVRRYLTWSPEPPRAGADVFRRRGVYFFTGGAGTLGHGLALQLAREYEAKLVLFSRSATSRCEPPLEVPDADILRLDGDVTDFGALSAAIRAALERFGRIDGVFHLAGLPGGGLIETRAREDMRQVCAPKVEGALALIEAFRDSPLTFMVFFSSIASVAGALGQCDYSAANSFLDALPRSATAKTLPFRLCTIVWDAWQTDSWQERMLGALPEAYRAAKAHRDVYGIRFDEGLQVLRTALEARLRTLIVSTRELPLVMAAQRSIRLDGLAPAVAPEPAVRREDGDPILPALREIWRDLLGEARASAQRFLELGGHSLLAIQMASRVQSELGFKVELRWLLANPTVEELAAQICGAAPAPAQSELEQILAEIEAMPCAQTTQVHHEERV